MDPDPNPDAILPSVVDGDLDHAFQIIPDSTFPSVVYPEPDQAFQILPATNSVPPPPPSSV